MLQCHQQPRSIPAWAGETCLALRRCCHPRVYPRVGGGNRISAAGRRLARGLSPRGRGKHVNALTGAYGARSIPAWAGETFCKLIPYSAARVYPRVGGGNRRLSLPAASTRGLSPRGRGKLNRAWACAEPVGSIPAWAGETVCALAFSSAPTVYPRVGGGNTDM